MGLEGTLTPLGVLSPADVMQLQIMQELAKNTQQASQAQQQAAQQYQQAAAAPPPDIGAFAALIPALAGNFASVIGGNPEYQRQAQGDLAAQRKGLAQQRLENLQALRDNQAQMAEAARQAGNLELENKSRMAISRFDKQIAQEMQAQELAGAQKRVETQEAGANYRARLAADTDKITAQIRASLTAGGQGLDPSQYVDQSESGYPYVVATKIPNIKARQGVVDYARSQGIPVLNDKQESALAAVQEARANIKLSLEEARKFLPTTARQRNLGGALKNVGASILQTDPNVASFNAFRTAAVNQIQALASLAPGLRLNSTEIRLAVQNDIPRITDALPTGEAKVSKVLGMLDRVEQALVAPRARRGAQAAPAPPARGNAPAPAAPRVRVLNPKGQAFEIDATDLPDALAHGWKRAPR